MTTNLEFDRNNISGEYNSLSHKERCDQLLGIQYQAYKLFEKKNKDYGDAFARYGIIGVLVRIGDKLSRLMNIEKNQITLVNDESIQDTLIDLHNYSAMALMLLKK